MCGLVGIYSLNGKEIKEDLVNQALSKLKKRGPDYQASKKTGSVCLGHARLSVIDISEESNQPFTDRTGNWTIIYNGEIFNYKELRSELEAKGIVFSTQGDVEVLLELYKYYGKDCLHKLNGYWAFAIFNTFNNQLFISRDRYGEKPLYYSHQEDFFYFGSEVKSLISFPFKKHLDKEALNLYFQLNYIPGPLSIIQEIKKLLPGHFISIVNDEVEYGRYYELTYDNNKVISVNYDIQKQKFKELVGDAVKIRMISDVPLGAFLSGGIDSSVIVSQASKFTKQLNTFSIGFADNNFFDETYYAELVAKKYKTNHTVFKLQNKDLLESLHELLDYIDEPFADSSALLVNLLSKYTKKHVTVALSGDGGDELFAGYNKHMGEYTLRRGGWKANAVSLFAPVWSALPKSRHGKYSNLFRQLERFAIGMKLSQEERYWRWCCFLDEVSVKNLLLSDYHPDETKIQTIKSTFLKYFTKGGDLNEVLLADVNLVLPYDMHTKVDSMSMRNSLEVRAPFLDYRIVEFAFSIPVSSKIDHQMKKKIIQDTFREDLPNELYNRSKRGFEVPLLQLLRTDLKDDIFNKYLNDKKIREVGIFNPSAIQEKKDKLLSNSPGDIHAQIWALIIFQSWFEKYKEYIELS
ncbi:MAG: asparagine synthase (glutamine-hydrolyzing) [Chitinophagales bacterium]|nr:asparagine synthase (glutamine-hydrolyzing) [Chitinophagales bacterium]